MFESAWHVLVNVSLLGVCKGALGRRQATVFTHF